MTDHKVVAMPKPENLERRVNVKEFVRSQDLRQPPNIRRPLTPGRQTRPNFHHSKSPRRGRSSGSRDIVQEVYDRMGVNYVRGQSSVGIYDSNGSLSVNSEAKNKASQCDASKLSDTTPSNLSSGSRISTTFVKDRCGSFNRPDQGLTLDTSNELQNQDRDERNSCRSTRSVKSLMSAFGGGKSVGSGKSIASRNSTHEPEFQSIQRSGVREKIIDCRNDNDMDRMSMISLDESQWITRKQEPEGEDIPDSEMRSSQALKSCNGVQTSMKVFNDRSSSINNVSATVKDEMIHKIIDEKIEEKVAELNSVYEEKYRSFEEHTNRRLEEIEMKLKLSLMSSSERKDCNFSTFPNPK